MAAGKPVVASDIAGYRFVLQHDKQGLLVPPEDRAALAKALIYLLRHEEVRQRMGAAGRERAAEFSWQNVARMLLDYYNRLIEAKERRLACSRTI